MKITKLDIATAITAIIPLGLTAVLYSALPASVPMQWGFNGEVRYDAKWQLWLIASMPILLTGLMRFLPLIDPRKGNYQRFAPQLKQFILVFNLFLLAMVGIVLWESFNPGTVQVDSFVPALVGALLIFIGNMMPKFKSNFFMGIKTPWTLSSEEVWNKTHRLAGILWVVGGGLMVLSVLIPGQVLRFAIMMTVVAIIIIIPSVMSFVWYRQLNPKV